MIQVTKEVSVSMVGKLYVHYVLHTFDHVYLLCTCTFRWKLIVHGGIDGYSRLVVYLKCADNNRACTVMQAFSEAV